MFVKPVNFINHTQKRQSKNCYHTNLNSSYKSDSVSFGRTTAIMHIDQMPLEDIAYQIGSETFKAEKGTMLFEKMEEQIGKLYEALDTNVKAILKTKPLTDNDPEQCVHIITPQHEKPSIVYEAQGDVLDASYIHPQTDDVFSFRFVKGKLVNVLRCSAADLASLPSAGGKLVEFAKESGQYKIADIIPTFLSKNITAPPYLYN